MTMLDDLEALAGRLGDLQEEPADQPARAAVAAILRPGVAGTEILFIRRAVREGDPWSGQMAFPGGKREPADRDLLHTAVRETEEEIGVDLLRHGRLLGPLADTSTHRSDLVVRPYVFLLDRAPRLGTSDEVAETIWAPISPLARGEATGTYTFQAPGVALELPCHRIGEHVVWGLTYRFLELLFAVARP